MLTKGLTPSWPNPYWKIPGDYDGSTVLVRATVLYEYSKAGHQRKEVSI